MITDPLVAVAMVAMIVVAIGAVIVLHVAVASPTTGLVVVALVTHPAHNVKCALKLT
jgi:hypothetical protein